MNRLLTTLAAVLILAGSAPAQSRPKRPAPKAVEENGKKVLVFTMGQTTDEIRVGDALFRFLPLEINPPTKTLSVGYTLTNTKRRDDLPFQSLVITQKQMSISDDIGDTYKAESILSGPSPNVQDLHAGKSYNFREWFRPLSDPKVKEVRIEYTAKSGSADIWRVVYPRRTWKITAKRPPNR